MILKENRHVWELPEDVTTEVFVKFLLEKTKLRSVKLKSRYYKPILRYTWDQVSPYQLALSLGRNAYLSHGSAVFLHRLTDQVPTTIYLNQEQTPKPCIKRALTQEAVDLAFSRPQRRSSYILKHEKWRIVVIRGKNTGKLEVGELLGLTGERLKVTRLERTLIDIAVRPGYAGGVLQVLEAFEAAKDRVRVSTLVATLKKLNYVYPYHQAVGFYMERAGYKETSYKKLRSFGLTLNFYLGHGLRDVKYDNGWRIYYPKGL
ncbi:MAG: hypothetical protein ACE5JQ_13355 [Candidatus Methylomirabilales bacterium]